MRVDEKLCSSVIKIQRCFRRYIKMRYSKNVKNYDDLEPIMFDMTVSMVPRDLLIILGEQGFHAHSLAPWLMNSNVNPVTRQNVPPGTRSECVEKIINFYRNDLTSRRRKGFYKLKRKVKGHLRNSSQHLRISKKCSKKD